MDEKMENLLTKKQTAGLFHISERTLDRWRSRGVLTPFKYGGIIRFDPQAVAAVIAKHSRPGRPAASGWPPGPTNNV
jgi:hypothetical protein